MRRNKKISKGNYWGGGRFVAVPHEVLKSQSYISLSVYAQKLLIDLLAQHNGYNNNGDLCATWSLMKKRGWKSPSTLNNAKRELEEKQFIVVARQGGRNKPTLYAITFFRVDVCKGKLDIPDTLYPSDDWKSNESNQKIGT